VPDDERLRGLVGDGAVEGRDEPGFAALADALDLLADPDLWADPPPGLGARIDAAVRAESTSPPAGRTRSRRRRWVVAAAGAVAAAAAILLVITVVDSGPDGTNVALAATENAPGAGGSATITETDAGVRVELDAWGLPPHSDDEYYEAWLTSEQGWVPLGAVEEGKEVVLSAAGVSLDGYEGLCVTRREKGADRSGAHDASEQLLYGQVRRSRSG
jgi:Anti-sigma-K factor rskA